MQNYQLHVCNYEIIVYICVMKVDISNLMTVKNYAKREDVTTSYIYKLIKEGKMSSFVIDGMQFIQVNVYPSIPVIHRRK